jgi:hypothetical protein
MSTLIKTHERGLLFEHGDFARVLMPGRYRFWQRLWNPQSACVEKFNTLETYIKHPLLDTFAERPEFQAHAHVLSLSDTQRTLVWKDERLAFILGPGRHALWKTPFAIKTETFEIGTLRFDHPKLSVILQHPAATTYLEGVQVPAYETVLLFRDGVLMEQLREGVHVFWKGTGKLAFKSIDRREQVADVAGQEIMTADKVTLRVNLVVTYQVQDRWRRPRARRITRRRCTARRSSCCGRRSAASRSMRCWRTRSRWARRPAPRWRRGRRNWA